jgi:uncharacterized protein (DUF2344 family)
MILYNVTVNIDEVVAEEWLVWMKEVHIPEVMKTGFFVESKICRILAHEEGGLSYSIQYLAASQQDFDEYERKHASALQEQHSARYAGKFAAFRTLLRVEQLYKTPV